MEPGNVIVEGLTNPLRQASADSDYPHPHMLNLEKVACGPQWASPFSDNACVSGRKRRDFCGLHRWSPFRTAAVLA
jgi:hypothetical protein